MRDLMKKIVLTSGHPKIFLELLVTDLTVSGLRFDPDVTSRNFVQLVWDIFVYYHLFSELTFLKDPD